MKELLKMMGLYRKTYNRALDEGALDVSLSRNDLRDKFSNHNLSPQDLYLDGLMRNIRELAVFEAHKNLSTASKMRERNWFAKINRKIYDNIRKMNQSKQDKTKDKYWEIVSELWWERLFPPSNFPVTMEHKTKKSPTQCMDIPKETASYYEEERKLVISPAKHKLVIYLKEAPKSYMISKTKTAGKFDFLKNIKILLSCNGVHIQVPYDKDAREEHIIKQIKQRAILRKDYKGLLDFIRNEGPFDEDQLEMLHQSKRDIETQLIELNKLPKPKPERNGFIALDPGLRTFLTGVDHNGTFIELGIDCIGKLNKNIENRNKSQRDFESGRPITKGNLQRKYAKISNKILDMHRKISKRLEEYEHVLLPKLSTKDICRNKSSKFADNAHILAHCKFYDRVNMNHDGLVRTDESYTTKMCCNCFKLNNIGMSKCYTCDACSFESDRDINSAVNILIKNTLGAGFLIESSLDSLGI